VGKEGKGARRVQEEVNEKHSSPCVAVNPESIYDSLVWIVFKDIVFVYLFCSFTKMGYVHNIL